jgi:hypothetical protein
MQVLRITHCLIIVTIWGKYLQNPLIYEKVMDRTPLSSWFESQQGLWIFSCQEAIQAFENVLRQNFIFSWLFLQDR